MSIQDRLFEIRFRLKKGISVIPGQSWTVAAVCIVAAVWLSKIFLPSGLPNGVLLLGSVDGALYGLTAFGLVLVYRSQRVVNFAQAEIGGLSVSVAVVLVSVHHVEYFVALFLGLLAALITGLIVHFVVEWRFKDAPRMILTVATIGIAQLVGALEIGIPYFLGKQQANLITFSTPFSFHFTVSSFVFTGDHVMAMSAALVCGLGLWVFLEKTNLGIAIRAGADSRERAQLLGIPVRRLSMATWIIAAGLSAIGAMAAAPNSMGNPPDLSAVAGPISLLPPLAAAIVGRMEKLSVTFIAAIFLGVFQQGIYWSYPRSSVVDVGFFVIILLSLLLQPPKSGRSENRGSSSFVDTRAARPIPKEVANFTQIKLLRKFVPIVLAVLFIVVPAVLGQSVSLPFSYMVIYGIMTVSLVLLSGWAGQISLGQSGFAGVGAATVGLMIMNYHTDLFISLVLAGVVGTLFSVAIGIPSLRIPGFFLSVATMAFAVPVDTFLLNATHFPSLNPSPVTPPELFSRFDMGNVSVLYIVASIILFGLIIAVKNLRSSRTGRALIGIRDNEPGAQAYGVSPVALKLTAFAIAGAMTGVAGGLLTILQHGSAFSGFDPQLSFTIFIGVVVGGLGSLSGALLGAIFLGFTQYYLSGIIALAVQGMVVLGFLTLFPEGFGGIATFVRDVYVKALAKRHGILLIGPVNTTDLLDETEKMIVEKVRKESVPILIADEVYAKYGQVEVLFGVTSEVGNGDVLALLGTNGAGKSTLLRVISGLMKATHGGVFLDGVDISRMHPEARVGLGLVTSAGGRGVFTSLTVKENLRMASWLYRKDLAYILRTLNEIGELFPVLLERLNVQAGQLSGGEQQMLAISMAKLLKPRVLLIDELSLGLAPVVVAKIVDAVSEMKKEGMTVVVVEQSVNVATLLAKDAVFLERGQVRFGGPINDLLGREDILRSVFLGGGAKVIHDMTSQGVPAEDKTALGVVSKVRLRDIGVAVEDDESGPRFEIQSVSKRFGGLSAVDEVSITVAPGAIQGIIGANGAGKTTLFDICSGFCIPDSGSVLLEGVPITHLSPHWRSRHGLGRVFQHAALFSSLTVFETLELSFERFIIAKEPVASMTAMPAARNMEKKVREKATELMEMLHLESWKDSFISELSTGTRRVVELGAVLAHRPRVLLLDEPSSGLAQREAESLGPLLLEVKNATGASMVVIEHDVPLIASMADELTCMHVGRVIANGTPELVLSKDEVISSFLGSAKEVIARSDGITLPTYS